MKMFLTLLLLFMLGCRSLPHDRTPPPINHNLMTQEIQACGQQNVGLSGCLYNEAKEGELKIPLWSSGEYQIKSERCNYFINSRYEGSQVLELSFHELLAQKPEEDDTCLYNIKVFIDGFDNGFEGFFLLSKGDLKALQFDFQNKRYTGYAGLQVREGLLVSDRLNVIADTSGTIIWEGCMGKGKRKYDRDPQINFQEIIGGSPIPKASCVLTVGIIPDDESLPVELGKVHINIYEKTVVSLSQPALGYNKDDEKLTVRGERLVAAIMVNDKYVIKKGNGKKKFTTHVPIDEEVNVRIATSNGRFMLLKVKNGDVLWIK